MSGVTTSSLSIAWSLRNWVMLDYEEDNGLTIRPWAPFLFLSIILESWNPCLYSRNSFSSNSQILFWISYVGRDYYTEDRDYWMRKRIEQEISFSPALLPSSSLCLLSSNTRAGKRESTMGLKDRKKSLAAVNLSFSFRTPSISFRNPLSCVSILLQRISGVQQMLGFFKWQTLRQEITTAKREKSFPSHWPTSSSTFPFSLSSGHSICRNSLSLSTLEQQM